MTLKNGRARVKMILEPDKLGPIYSNARLLLRPKTGLNDMSIDLDPGTPEQGKPDQGKLEDGDVLPVWNSLPNVQPGRGAGRARRRHAPLPVDPRQRGRRRASATAASTCARC